ncbi:MAG: acetyl-CoA carboxylase biotin carboxyl carrier protein subunit [Vicinamibacterales bacterium]
MADARVTSVGDGWYLVQSDEGQALVGIAAERDAMWVYADGIVARVESANETRRSARTRGDSSVMSPMPATVVAIHAIPGQAVAEGETIIVLEAMKMELPIKAPRSGVVKAVHCAKGELVQPGVNLLELD